MAKTSVRELSRVTGYSPATVSNALNHKKGVSEETARMILEAARELGYQAPSQLESIHFISARKHGKILDETTFHPAVIEGVERQARRYDMTTSFVSLDFSRLEEVEPQVKALISDPSNALVLLGTELTEDDFALFANADAKMVVLDSWSDRQNFDAVVMANTESVLCAMSYLFEKGHTRIGYLAGDVRIQNFKAREMGVISALLQHDLTLNPAWRVELGTTLETSYQDMLTWLNDYEGELPTAFFADNDVLAVGALRAFAEKGIRVPEDVSIIGFDDLAIGAISTPPLTTIHVRKHEVGEIAVRRLVGNITNPKDYTCKTHVNTYFVERDSVRSVAG